jgi:transposase
MPMSRRPYPPEFRQQILELVRLGKKPVQLSQEFGCCTKTILNWIEQSGISKDKALSSNGLSNAEHEELSRLRRENRQLKIERDILSKATAWFAGRGEKTYNASSNL